MADPDSQVRRDVATGARLRRRLSPALLTPSGVICPAWAVDLLFSRRRRRQGVLARDPQGASIELRNRIIRSKAMLAGMFARQVLEAYQPEPVVGLIFWRVIQKVPRDFVLVEAAEMPVGRRVVRSRPAIAALTERSFWAMYRMALSLVELRRTRMRVGRHVLPWVRLVDAFDWQVVWHDTVGLPVPVPEPAMLHEKHGPLFCATWALEELAHRQRMANMRRCVDRLPEFPIRKRSTGHGGDQNSQAS